MRPFVGPMGTILSDPVLRRLLSEELDKFPRAVVPGFADSIAGRHHHDVRTPQTRVAFDEDFQGGMVALAVEERNSAHQCVGTVAFGCGQHFPVPLRRQEESLVGLKFQVGLVKQTPKHFAGAVAAMRDEEFLLPY